MLFCFICGIITSPGIMKKFLIVLLAPCLLMAGCFKDSIHNDHDGSAVVAIFNGGPDTLSKAPLDLAGPDSLALYITVGVSTPYTLNHDITLTLKIDDSKRIAYNQTHFNQFDSLPDSLYSFNAKTVVLPAGTRSVLVGFEVYGGKANLRNSYMLPVSITDAQGVAIDGVLGTIYYNQLGSPLSGQYSVKGTRTDYLGPVSSGIISDTINLSALVSKYAVTDTKNVVFIDYSDLGSAGWQYIVVFTAGTNLVSITPNLVITDPETGCLANSFIVDTQTYDPDTETLHFKTEYSDLNGNGRVVDEYLTRFR